MNGKVNHRSFLKKGLQYFKLEKYFSHWIGNEEDGSGISDQEFERLNRILQKQPQNLEALLGKGTFLLKAGQAEEAGEYFNRALELDSNNPKVYLLKGDAAAGAGNHEEAMWLYLEVLNIDPASVEALIKTARAFYHLKLYKGALKYIDKLLARDPEHVEALFLKGLINKDAGKLENAISIFHRIIAKNDRHYQAYFELARCYSFLDDNEKAVELCNKTVEINPGFALAWLQKGILLNKLNEDGYLDMKEEELEYYEKAIALDPLNYIIWRNKALTLYEMDQFVEALAALDRALELHPASLKMMCLKCKILFDNNQMETCIDILDEITAKTINLRYYWQSKGICYQRLKNESKAEECFKKARRFDKQTNQLSKEPDPKFLPINNLIEDLDYLIDSD